MTIVEDLENAIDIVELVSKYATLKKAGVNYKALCPFPGHSEKTPSFVVSPSKQLAYCFGCHKGGGALKFVMDIENCEFREAIQILGNFTGIKVNSNFDKKSYAIKKSIYSLYKDAVNYYKKALKNNPNIEKYLFDRGLKKETIEKFNFGYSDSGVNLYNYLKEKGYDDKILGESKIFLDSNLKKDKFLNRIIFPIQSLRGDFVALAGRIIGKGEPKYLNSPASKIYDKSSILYGLYSARNTITKRDFIIVTEGYMDTITLQEAGFFNTVAVSGTALTSKHIQIIKRLTHKIYLCFDGDKAGEKATKLSLELLKNKGLEIKIITLPTGKDPDDIITSGKDFNNFIKDALSPIGYYIKKSDFNTNSIDDKKKLLEKLLDIIVSYSDQIEKETYIKEVSKLLNISENTIYDKLNLMKFKIKSKSPISNLEGQKKKNFSLTDLAISYILSDNTLADFFEKNLVFKDEINFDLKNCIKDPQKFWESLELNKKEKLKAMDLILDEKNENKNTKEKNIKDLIFKINKNSYKKIIARLKELMKQNNLEAFKKYSKIMKVAKLNNII